MENNKETERKECKMCGKKLPEQDMYRKIEIKDGTYYFCCQLCYEQFSGKPFSGDSEIEYQ